MPRTPVAMLSRNPAGHWRVFVVLEGSVAAWPEMTFPSSGQVPTLADRYRALRTLGYTPQSIHTEWVWTEHNQDPDEPDSPTLLIATTSVWEVEPA